MLNLHEQTKYGYDLKAKEKTKSFIIEIEQKITIDDIENIIVTSVEGGSNYWMGIDNSTSEWADKPEKMPISQYIVELILAGKTVKFYDIEDEDDTENDWTLTLDKLLNGFKLNAQQRPEDSDLDNADATTADCIIQYAMFGEVVYG